MKRISVAIALALSAALVQAQPVTNPQLLEAYAKFREMGPNLNPQVIDETGVKADE